MSSRSLKGSFTGTLEVQYIDGNYWTVENSELPPFAFHIDGGDSITIPDGFKTDFASIPRPFWLILPPTGDGKHSSYGKAAVIHDYLYQYGKCNGRDIQRKFADDIFLCAMTVLGVVAWKRNVMYSAVRLFGGSSFKRNPKI